MAQKVIVVGGGAAGLMAAGQAASQGASVLLIEKKERPGRKVRITGKGRCNLTNVAPIADFVERFGPNGRFLRQAFARFFSSDLVSFLGELGVSTEVERGGRVFPSGNDAREIVDALVDWANQNGVKTELNTPVEGLIVEGKRVVGVRAGKEYRADAVILATGGKSYPATGSTGDGYALARYVGHAIVPVRPALVPLETSGDTAQRLQGLSLKNVSARLLVDERKAAERFGEMLFTHYGLSGPIILSLSRTAVDALSAKQKTVVSLDLKPALDHDKLDARLLRDIGEHGKRKFHTLLKGLLPAKLIPVCSDLVEISPDKPSNQLSAAERKRLRLWLKDFRLNVSGRRSYDEAIVTAGGVELREIDPKTMASRIAEGLFIVGELLDIDGDTGGYNLQAAFSTGWLAGRVAAGRKE